MKYLFLVTMRVDGYKWFIKLGKYFDLNMSFNITNEIFVDEIFCTIKRIFHNIDDEETWLYLEMDEPQHVVENSEQAIQILIDYIEEFKEYGWYLDNYDLNGWRLKDLKNK